MRRYWIPKEFISPTNDVLFIGDVFHHIFDVCRQEVGHHFEVLTGDQKAHLVEVTLVEKRKALAKIKETRIIPAIKTPHIHLALSVPRYPVMEAVVEKAVELGVHTIHPFFSDYSFVRKSSSLPENKVERWHKIIISATQQCGRGDLMELKTAIPLDQLLKDFNQIPHKVGLFAYEGQAKRDIKQYLSSVTHQGLEQVWIFAGSEGGFSQPEVQSFQDLRLDSITLGEQILRVETACIAMVSVLKYEFGLMQ